MGITTKIMEDLSRKSWPYTIGRQEKHKLLPKPVSNTANKNSGALDL